MLARSVVTKRSLARLQPEDGGGRLGRDRSVGNLDGGGQRVGIDCVLDRMLVFRGMLLD